MINNPSEIDNQADQDYKNKVDAAGKKICFSCRSEKQKSDFEPGAQICKDCDEKKDWFI